MRPAGRKGAFFAACRLLAGPVVRGPGVDWQCPASLVGFDPTLLSCAKKRGVEPPRRSCPKEPLGRGSSGLFPKQKGPRSLCHPGAARYRDFPSRAMLRTFERSLVGGTTNLADPTRRKANFLWKFLCAGTSPSAMRTPSPIAAHPQGFLQSKNALRRTSASKFAARQHNHQLSCKPVSACKPERECYQKPQKIAPLKGSSNLEPPGFQKGRGPFVSEGVQRKPFQGFPLGNFFAAARHRASLRS